MPSRMQGTPWHIGYVKAKGGRRHRSRCIHFIPKHKCKLIGNCCGSSHCAKYKEKENKKKYNLNETYRPKNKKSFNKKSAKKVLKAKGIKLGDTVELLDKNDDFKMKVHIVKTEQVCLEESKIAVDSPIAKAVLGKKKGDKVEIFTDKKVIYEIVGWTKQ